jgi:dienelactone hydrolase
MKKTLSIALLSSLLIVGCSQPKTDESASTQTADSTIIEVKEPSIVQKEVTYMAGNDTLKGYYYFDENSPGVKPGIMVVHEWWGNNEYPQMRAKMLAEMGYAAFTVDMYGNGLTVDNPTAATEQSGKIYSNPELLKSRMMAGYEKFISMENVNPNQMAAIGYCFGGTVALNAANLGVPLDAVVSFHGGLAGFNATPEMAQTKVLVCHGLADKFVSEEDVTNFKKGMDKVTAPYEFINYENATHAFTNENSTAVGEKFSIPISYNEAADKKSWEDMKMFFEKNYPL